LPSTTLRPSGDNGTGSWSAPVFSKINDQNDATLTSISDGNDSFLCGMDNMPAEAARVDTVTPYFRANKESGWTGQIRQYIELSASYSNGTLQTPPDDPSVTEYTDSLARPGGGDWSISDVNTAQSGATSSGGNAGKTGRVTEIRWEVAYSLGGGWGALVASILGPVVGGAITMNDAWAIRDMLWQRNQRLLSCEVRPMWQALREYPGRKIVLDRGVAGA